MVPKEVTTKKRLARPLIMQGQLTFCNESTRNEKNCIYHYIIQFFAEECAMHRDQLDVTVSIFSSGIEIIFLS